MKKDKKLLLMVVPVFLIYLIFFLYPAINSAYVSFFSWRGFKKEMDFVGLSNYRELLSDTSFLMCIKNTLIYMFAGGFLIFLLAFLFVWSLSIIRYKNFFKVVIFIPNMIALVAVANMWTYIYNPNFGLVNGILRLIKLDILAKPWMSPSLIIWSIIVATVWVHVGFFSIILNAGASKIPISLYEGADIEGASQTTKFFKITLPLIHNELKVAVLFWLIMAIKMFEFIYAFAGSAGGMPSSRSWTLTVYMYMLSFGQRTVISRMGYASTVAIVILIMVSIVYGLVNIIFKKETVEY